MLRHAVINVVGLTQRLLGTHTPFLNQFFKSEGLTTIRPVIPAVTCTAQATYFTGQWPDQHGIVANGWFDRDYAEHRFWKQPETLVQSPKLWDLLKAENPSFTCAKVFWWFNMYSSADYSITPRPLYPADGSKHFDVHTHPMSDRQQIQSELGSFPFSAFWGPLAGLPSSQWIAEAAKWYETKYHPTLSLVYLPHLDYNLQRHGLNFNIIHKDISEIDSLLQDLVTWYQQRDIKVTLLSEYGITDVNTPVHLNRIFREQGWLSIKDELGLETLDQGNCLVHAITDHQIAHVYIKNSELIPQVQKLLQSHPDIDRVLLPHECLNPLQHQRSGDLIIIAKPHAWFTYYFWFNDAVAPDYARCVDIHRKCGYDPTELFLDSKRTFIKWSILKKLIFKKLGFRTLMNVIPLDAKLVKGSHGICPPDPLDYPILSGSTSTDPIQTNAVFHLLLKKISTSL
jgi:predicted AlkP superfamily pyrophosphatase or phosphodiesterase